MKVSLNTMGMLRICVASPELRIADVSFNTGEIIAVAKKAASIGCQLLLLPELAITGYTCADLFYQSLLLQRAKDALWEIAGEVKSMSVVLGCPIHTGGRLFNCAVFLAGGNILGIVPKTFVPNTGEFYEKRWFSGAKQTQSVEIESNGRCIPFGTDLLFQCQEMPECVVGIEICEDLWAVSPPSGAMAKAGATVLLNPSASNEVLGKADYREMLVRSQSARCLAAYGYASCGPCESSTDLVFSGHCMIAEYGAVLAQTRRFQFSTQMAFADIDVERLYNERLKNDSFAQVDSNSTYRTINFSTGDIDVESLARPIVSTPFVPSRPEERSRRCREIFAIQTTALARRLRHTGSKSAVIGISGGLDSTLALLVALKAFAKLDRPKNDILAITMPGFGTTHRTSSNAEKLVKFLGVSTRTIPISKSVERHFRDIGHDPDKYDITYENSQARERTQILMDIANQSQGLVIGTGDLSELALGWCTYNGDHMSMYAVNAGVPKTLVRYLIEWCAKSEFPDDAAGILLDICATPISPELLPPDKDGKIKQVTEDSIGPYLLHDFFLYHTIRLQFSPRKVLFLANLAFADKYGSEEIAGWLKVFYHRFFSQQFKRSCLPDGPKVGTVSLSPRGDWRMPSDAVAKLWLDDISEK